MSTNIAAAAAATAATPIRRPNNPYHVLSKECCPLHCGCALRLLHDSMSALQPNRLASVRASLPRCCCPAALRPCPVAHQPLAGKQHSCCSCSCCPRLLTCFRCTAVLLLSWLVSWGLGHKAVTAAGAADGHTSRPHRDRKGQSQYFTPATTSPDCQAWPHAATSSMYLSLLLPPG